MVANPPKPLKQQKGIPSPAKGKKRKNLPLHEDLPKHVRNRPDVERIRAKTRKTRYIWRQRKEWGESAKSYMLFLKYRDLPSEERSIRRIGELTNRKYRSCVVLATRFKWRRRVEAYIEYMTIKGEQLKLRAIEQLHRDEIRLGSGMMRRAQRRVKKVKVNDAFAVSALAKTGSDIRRRGLNIPKDPDVKVNVQNNTQVNLLSLIEKLDKADEEMKRGGLTVV